MKTFVSVIYGVLHVVLIFTGAVAISVAIALIEGGEPASVQEAIGFVGMLIVFQIAVATEVIVIGIHHRR